MEAVMKFGSVNGIAPTAISSTYRPNSNDDIASTHNRYAMQALQLLEEGKFQAALPLLNICLGDSDEADTSDLEAQVADLLKNANYCKITRLPPGSDHNRYNTDENSLIEKRCLVNMRLRRYSKVVQDARKMLDFTGENPVAYKCLLIALCKMKKLEQANEVIKLWQKNSPRDLDMMESRTKLENLMVAVKNGIEASDAFSDVEDLLGLNFDWLLLRKSKDPQWKYRPLPTSSRCSFVLCLQYRFGHCSLGEKCPDAHGEAELEEWKKRYEIENVSRKINNLKIDDGSTYTKELLNIVQSGKSSILTENDSEQIRISCISHLHTTVQQRKFRKFTWKFTVKTTKPLTYICLLHEHHRQYFHVSSCSFVGPNDSIILNQAGKSEINVIVPQLSEAALAIAGGNFSSYTYKVKVVFTPEVYGNFRQTVVFDIGDKTKTIRNVSVDVVPPPDSGPDAGKGGNENSSSPVERGKGFRNNVPWNFGNADQVDGNTGEKMASEKLGFALIGSSFTSKTESFMENTKDPLSKDHYKERMRFLLTQEERSRQEILAKYNVTTNVHLSEKYIVTGGYNEGMARYAVDGTLYGKISLFRDISEDTVALLCFIHGYSFQ